MTIFSSSFACFEVHKIWVLKETLIHIKHLSLYQYYWIMCFQTRGIYLTGTCHIFILVTQCMYRFSKTFCLKKLLEMRSNMFERKKEREGREARGRKRGSGEYKKCKQNRALMCLFNITIARCYYRYTRYYKLSRASFIFRNVIS